MSLFPYLSLTVTWSNIWWETLWVNIISIGNHLWNIFTKYIFHQSQICEIQFVVKTSCTYSNSSSKGTNIKMATKTNWQTVQRLNWFSICLRILQNFSRYTNQDSDFVSYGWTSKLFIWTKGCLWEAIKFSLSVLAWKDLIFPNIKCEEIL